METDLHLSCTPVLELKFWNKQCNLNMHEYWIYHTEVSCVLKLLLSSSVYQDTTCSFHNAYNNLCAVLFCHQDVPTLTQLHCSEQIWDAINTFMSILKGKMSQNTAIKQNRIYAGSGSKEGQAWLVVPSSLLNASIKWISMQESFL
jgi:hypothetical protein